jgi:hypothetical protein
MRGANVLVRVNISTTFWRLFGVDINDLIRVVNAIVKFALKTLKCE